MVTKQCTDCPRQAPADRKLCWHCTNFKTRYGMTHEGVMAARQAQGTICELCQKMKQRLSTVKGVVLCPRCKSFAVLFDRPGVLDVCRKLVPTVRVNATEFDTAKQLIDSIELIKP